MPIADCQLISINQRPLDVALGFAFGFGGAFVVKFFGAGYAYVYLGFATFQDHSQRDQGHALLFNRFAKMVDLRRVGQQLAGRSGSWLA